MHSNRGVDVLLEAAGLMDEIDVLVLGPRLGPDLPANVRPLEHVRHHQVGPHLAACDVLVLPGRSEDHYARHSSPLKLFEYMASGRPIVASDLPGLREVVTHGETAWLVTPDDPAALAAGVRQVLSLPDRGASLGARGRAAVAGRTWTNRARAMLAAVGLEPPGPPPTPGSGQGG
jgi:glycosyltransferase involved in cell wall biosynthesis